MADDVKGLTVKGWQPPTKTWRHRPVKGRQIARSAKQLCEQFGVTYSPDLSDTALQTLTAPLWVRYLSELRGGELESRIALSPLPQKVKSIQQAIHRFESQGLSTDDLLAELKAIVSLPVDVQETTIADRTIVPPELRHLETLGELSEGNELVVKTLTRELNKSVKRSSERASSSLESMMFAWIKNKKANSAVIGSKGDNYDMPFRVIVETLPKNIQPAELNFSHADALKQALVNNPKLNDTTRYYRMKRILTLLNNQLHRLNLPTGFLKDKSIRFHEPEGKKVRYTMEQVKFALNNATDINRLALLVGLNTGSTVDDVCDIRREHFANGRINKGRTKHKAMSTKPVGSWLLWEDTRQALDDVDWVLPSYSKLEKSYNDWASANALPSHKALRKAVQQLIQDNPKFGEHISMLYRLDELTVGTHNKNYASFTEAQKLTLDDALRYVAEVLGVK